MARNELRQRAAELYDARLSWEVAECKAGESVDLDGVREHVTRQLEMEMLASEALRGAAAAVAVQHVARGIEDSHEDSLAEDATYRLAGVIRINRKLVVPTFYATAQDILLRRQLREANLATVVAANAREHVGEDVLLKELRAFGGRATIGDIRPDAFAKAA